MKPALLRVLMLSCALVAPVASAERDGTERTPPGGLEYRFEESGPLLAAGVLSLVLPGKLAHDPPKCRWCDRERTNGIDAWGRKGRWVNDCGADALSYITLGASVADGLVGSYGGKHEWGVNAGTFFDSLAVSTTLVQLTKYTVRRQRPSAHGCMNSIENGPDHDENLSFFSGHTATAFTAVFAAATIAHQRGYRREPVIWAVGLPFATLTGYLRVAGNRHNLIDVVVGAGVGAAAGIIVPRYLHRPRVETAGPTQVAGTALVMPVRIGGSTPLAAVRLSGASRGLSLTWAW